MYGFNLGQIEGLDSSVQTVTLTIANATDSNTYTLNKAHEDPLIWSDGLDLQSTTVYIRLTDGAAGLYVIAFEESDVGDTYNVTISTSAVEENFKSAVETVLVDNGLINAPETLFDGTITITDGPAEIPFNVDVSSYPIEKWTVTVNDEPLEYNGEVFANSTETHVYVVGNNNGVYKFLARNDDGIIPGDYQVKITGIAGEGGGESGGSSGLPDVSASDNGSVLGVVNGEWGVDDRLKDYPSISNNDGAVLGFGVDRDGNRVAQSIVPAPMSYSTYSNNAFYLPFKDNNANQPGYIAVKLNARPVSQNYVTTPVLVDKYGSGTIESFAFNTAILPLTDTKTYTLKATVDNGSISFSWVADTGT